MDKITITLSRDDFDKLLLMAGYAIGAALGAQQRSLANKFVEVTNEMNKDNPGFVPYQILPSGKLTRVKAQ